MINQQATRPVDVDAETIKLLGWYGKGNFVLVFLDAKSNSLIVGAVQLCACHYLLIYFSYKYMHLISVIESHFVLPVWLVMRHSLCTHMAAKM